MRNVHAVVTSNESADAEYDAHHCQSLYGIIVAPSIESIDVPGGSIDLVFELLFCGSELICIAQQSKVFEFFVFSSRFQMKPIVIEIVEVGHQLSSKLNMTMTHCPARKPRSVF